MGAGAHCEIELKYLIRYPDATMLAAQPGCAVWQITQVYLPDGENGQTRRIRRVVTGGKTLYYRTFKGFISAMTNAEDEHEITREAYEAYFAQRDTQSNPIEKTRYRVPYQGHVLEFDLYPFWSDRAIMEIELEREDEAPAIPEWVEIIRDVTGDRAYKNRLLAMRVPMEAI